MQNKTIILPYKQLLIIMIAILPIVFFLHLCHIAKQQ